MNQKSKPYQKNPNNHKQHTIFQELHADNKQNAPLRMNYSHTNRERKYMYMGTQENEQQAHYNRPTAHENQYNLPKIINNHYSNYSSFSVSPKNQHCKEQISSKGKYSANETPNDVCLLKKELVSQRQKFKELQEKTISDQMHVLEQIALLDQKFHSMKRQKQSLQKELAGFRKSKESCYRQRNQDTDWQSKYNELYKQHKKVKGIQKALVDMMSKVQGNQKPQYEQYDLHDAWKWVKGVVWEYQAIKKKALQWKKVYDQVRYQQQ